MFDNKIIVEDSLRLVPEKNGFSVLARLPYYRGLGLSMIEDISINIDGQDIDRKDVLFAVRNNEWTLDQLETEYSDRWNFGEKAEVIVKDLPLTEGEHKITLAVRMRISYLPFVPSTKDSKILKLT
jgi:hypothetical protein